MRLTPSHSDIYVTGSHFHTSVIEGPPLQNLTSLQMSKLTSKDYKKNQRAVVVNQLVVCLLCKPEDLS